MTVVLFVTTLYLAFRPSDPRSVFPAETMGRKKARYKAR